MNRKPVRVSIVSPDGTVFMTLFEGMDFGSDLDKALNREVFIRDVVDFTKAAIAEADGLMHPEAILTGGKVPAHYPGAYPNLSCCGGETLLVPRS